MAVSPLIHSHVCVTLALVLVSYTAMVYTRGARSDYDNWAGLGNNGWSFEELLPLVKKVPVHVTEK